MHTHLTLVIVLALSTPLAATAELSENESNVIAEMNLARTNPKAYAEHLKIYKKTFINEHTYTTGSARIRTQEGTKAVDEAITFLLTTKPVPALTHAPGLSRAAHDHVTDQGPGGHIGHTGTDNSTSSQRIGRYGSAKGRGENIAFGPSKARDIVIQLIVDDGVPNRGHRINIFNPKFDAAGVSIGPHAKFNTMCVITYGTKFKAK